LSSSGMPRSGWLSLASSKVREIAIFLPSGHWKSDFFLAVPDWYDCALTEDDKKLNINIISKTIGKRLSFMIQFFEK
jgi:hypothetical protein